MSDPNHPFDYSKLDSFNRERTIEDPMHGPSAMHSILEVPEMPLGDGTYYRPGLGHISPDHFDANGLPLKRVIGQLPNTSAKMRKASSWTEWADAYRQGGVPMLTVLEGRRQQERMEETGAAHALKPTDVCGGRKRLDECRLAELMIKEASEIAASAKPASTSNEGRIWNVPPQLSRKCGVCALTCQVAYETNDGTPTGITRFTTARPLGGMDVIRIDNYHGSIEA